MTIDVSARPFAISITVLDSSQAVLSGPHAVTNALWGSAEITFPQFKSLNLDGWLPWTARITLKRRILEQLGFNGDPRSATGSPSGTALFAQGNQVDIQLTRSDRATFGTICPPLYILNINQPVNLPDEIIQLSLGDETLLEGRTPEGNESGFTRGQTTNRSTIINRYLAAANLPQTADVLSRFSLTNPPQKLNQDNWASEAGKVAGAAQSYGPWLNNAGVMRLNDVSFEATAPALSLSIGPDGDELVWEREANDERPPRKITCYANGIGLVEIDNPEDINEAIPGDGFTAQTTTGERRWDFGITPSFTEEWTERRAEKLIRPKDYTLGTRQATAYNSTGVSTFTQTFIAAEAPNTSTSLRDAIDYKRVVSYSNFTGKEIDSTITRKIARAISGGAVWEAIDGNSAALDLTEERTTIATEYDGIDGHMERRVTSVTKALGLVNWRLAEGNETAQNFITLNRLTEREVERITETWEEISGNTFGGDSALRSQRWRYRRTVLKPVGEVEENYSGISPTTLVTDHRNSILILGTEADGAAPPRANYQDDEYRRARVQYSGSATFVPPEGDAYKRKEDSITLNGDYVVGNGQCSAAARMLGNFQWGRANGARFVGALPDWMFDSFGPGARIDVTHGGEVMAYILDGCTVSLSNDNLLWGAGLALQGVVGATPDVVTPPIIVVSSLSGGVALTLSTGGETSSVTGLSGGVSLALSVGGVLREEQTQAQVCWDDASDAQWDGMTAQQWDGLASSDCTGETLNWDAVTDTQWDSLTDTQWDDL